jgi:hypothetical protein
MNNQGGSIENTHLGDVDIFGDLDVSGEIEGTIIPSGDVKIPAGFCLKTDCIQPSTGGGNVEIKNSIGNSIATFLDDGTINATSIFGNTSLLLSSDPGNQTVIELSSGAGITTAGVRLVGSKLNVDEIQSQTHEVSGDNPKILFTASKVEITGDVPIELQSANIRTNDIKAITGDLTVKATNGNQVLRIDDSVEELFVGQDAFGYSMPSIRGALGQVLTTSNTGISTFEDLPTTGSNRVIGTTTTPRTTYTIGVYQNMTVGLTGTDTILAGTLDIGSVLTMDMRGVWNSQTVFFGTHLMRLDINALVSAVSNDVTPSSNNGLYTNKAFALKVILTRTSATNINWVGNGAFTDNLTTDQKVITFGQGNFVYDPLINVSVRLSYQDNSAGGGYLRYIANSCIWTQADIENSIVTILSNDHLALNNLTLSDSGHTQFAMLNGRSGGQTINGGSALATEDLLLGANSVDPTLGDIKMLSDVIMSDRTLRGSVLPGGDLMLSSTADASKGQILLLDEAFCSSGLNMDATDITDVVSIKADSALEEIKITSSAGSNYFEFGATNNSFKSINMNLQSITNVSFIEGVPGSGLQLFGGSAPGTDLITNHTVMDSTYQIQTSAVPSGNTDLTNKLYVDQKDATKLSLDGTNAMTGDLNMSSNNIIGASEIQAQGGSTLKIFGAPNLELYGSSSPGGGIISLQTTTDSVYAIQTSLAPSAGNDLCNKTYVDGFLPLTGGTISSDLTVDGDLIIGGDVKQPETLPTRIKEGVDTDGVLVGYLEPQFDSSSTYLSATITKTGRNYVGASGARRWAIGTEVITCGTTVDNYKLVVRINSGTTGQWMSFALRKGWVSGTDAAIGSDYIHWHVNLAVGAVLVANTLSSTSIIDNAASQTVSLGDYIEFRLTNNCSTFEYYYHGQSLVGAPALLYHQQGIVEPDCRWQIGDGGGDVSTFNFDTIKAGIHVAESAIIDDDLHVGGDVTVGGAVNFNHTATADNDHGLELKYDAAGFSDGLALEINYTTGALAAGGDDDAMLISIDKTASTGGEIIGLAVLSTTGTAEAYAVEVGVGVNPLVHLVGTFEDVDIGLINAVDSTTSLNNTGSTDSIFIADNDSLTVGLTSQFSEIEILLDTVASGSGITPTFEYSTGVGTWQTFNPTDSTNGMRNNGLIVFLPADVSTWALSGSHYLIKITRTKNSLSTTPIISLAQVSTAAIYSWDKDAKVSCASADINGDTLSGTIHNLSHVIAGGFPVLSGLWSAIASQTIAATVTETTIFNSTGAMGTLIIPANTFQIGSCFHTHLSGYLKTKTTGGGETILWKLKFGTSIIAQTAPVTINIGTNTFWSCDIKYVIRTIGGSATLIVTGSFVVDDGVITSFGNFMRTTDYVFDSTIANTYDITSQWGSNDAANTLVCQIASNTTRFSS